MVFPVLIGGGILLGILFYFSNDIRNFLNKKDTGFFSEEQSKKRDAKGALGNSIDYVIGEGTSENLFKPSNKTSKLSGKTISYTDGSTVLIPTDNVINSDGTVSGSPPLLSIPESQKLQILSRRKNNG